MPLARAPAACSRALPPLRSTMAAVSPAVSTGLSADSYLSDVFTHRFKSELRWAIETLYSCVIFLVTGALQTYRYLQNAQQEILSGEFGAPGWQAVGFYGWEEGEGREGEHAGGLMGEVPEQVESDTVLQNYRCSLRTA
eukprot:753263-Hanusia_phi.AAC.7